MSKAKKGSVSKAQLNSNGYDISNFIPVKFPTIKSLKALAQASKSNSGLDLKTK